MAVGFDWMRALEFAKERVEELKAQVAEQAASLAAKDKEIERLRERNRQLQQSRDYQKDRAVKAKSSRKDLGDGINHWKSRAEQAERERDELREWKQNQQAHWPSEIERRNRDLERAERALVATEAERSGAIEEMQRYKSLVATAIEALKPFAALLEQYGDLKEESWISWVQFLSEESWPTQEECAAARAFVAQHGSDSSTAR